MNTKKLFKAAETAGIAPFEARITSESKLSVEIFNDTVENFTVADNGAFKVRGLVDGKCGVFTSDRADDEVIPMAIDAVKESAEFGQPVEPEFFVGNTYKYGKPEMYGAALDGVTAETFIALGKSVSEKARKADKRIELVTVQVEYCKNSVELANSNGLAVKDVTNYAMIYASAKAVDGEDVESGSHYEILPGPKGLDGFDADAFAAKLVKTTVDQLGGSTVASGKYKVVYSPDCVAALLTALKDGFSAFNVEQHVSLLEGKVGEKIFSPLFTVEQTPIGSEPFCASFDAEGVPCENRLLIDKGVVTGYVYDLATAKRAGVKSTGNGKLMGGNVRPYIDFVTVKNGDKTLDALFGAVGDGIYITDLGGVATGLNEQSGAYSLQASGYRIEGGKLGAPVSLITVAGNIMTDFNDIVAVGSDAKLTYYGVKTPSIAISSLAISGK